MPTVPSIHQVQAGNPVCMRMTKHHVCDGGVYEHESTLAVLHFFPDMAKGQMVQSGLSVRFRPTN